LEVEKVDMGVEENVLVQKHMMRVGVFDEETIISQHSLGNEQK
jgi:hypothetical protein